MVPTLFGVTVVSFGIMQLAPGDPLLAQLGGQGALGQSSQTREAYVIQKRDLKLDKPLFLNFRGFFDYRPTMREAAFFRARSQPEIASELAELERAEPGSKAAARIAFLQSLKIKDFRLRLAEQQKHARLAESIYAHIQVLCEDTGEYGVPAVMELLRDPDTDLQLKAGLIDCLKFMVVDPHQYTYSRNASDQETPRVQAVWKAWWDREKAKFPEIDPDRRKVLEQQLAEMSQGVSRARLSELLLDVNEYDREDLPFFVEHLLGDSSLGEKVASAAVLKLYVPKPLEMELSFEAPNGSTRLSEKAVIDTVAENWLLHYSQMQSRYEMGPLAKAWNVVADTQYAHMVWRLATFQFGRSTLKTREPVSEKIWRAAIVSAPLMLMAQLIIYFVSIPLGILCSVFRGKWPDRLVSLQLFFLFSLPPFVAGMIFLLLFCFGDYLKIFPMERLHSPGADEFGFARFVLDYLWHAALPVVCLSLFSLAGLAMYARSSMLDVSSQDYVRTARAKGVSELRVVFKHTLRNALIPILTLFSNFLPALLGGSVLIEVIFNVPGMGLLGWQSIEQKDVPTLMALIYVDAIVVLLSILLTDIMYVLVDPRINFQGQGKS